MAFTVKDALALDNLKSAKEMMYWFLIFLIR